MKAEQVAEAAARRAPGDIVVGWMAAFLLSADDRGGEGPLYNVDHLLELWDEIHSRLPNGRLWLVGEASDRVRQRVEGRADIVLFGRLPREQALATAANFDIALYPRTKDMGIQAAKVGEFIGLGIPTVSYDYEVTENLRETGAGLLVPTPREFADAVVHLGEDEAARLELAAAAKRAGADLDWDVLARRYEDEILDRYLPRLALAEVGHRRRGRAAARGRALLAPRVQAEPPERPAADAAPRRSRAARARAACRGCATRAIADQHHQRRDGSPGAQA